MIEGSVLKLLLQTIWNLLRYNNLEPSIPQLCRRTLPVRPSSVHQFCQLCSPTTPTTILSNYKCQICLYWNDSPGGCTRSTCRYEHICYRYVHNPHVTDKRHKAIDCPHKEKKMAAYWPLNSQQHLTQLHTVINYNYTIDVSCNCELYSTELTNHYNLQTQ